MVVGKRCIDQTRRLLLMVIKFVVEVVREETPTFKNGVKHWVLRGSGYLVAGYM